MLLIGQNRICRGRRPLALLLFTLERHVVYTITQAKQTIQIRNSKKIVKMVLEKLKKM